MSEALLILYPTGKWAKRPREIPTIVSRVRKVDPNWVDASSRSRRYVVDLDDIHTAYNEDQEENITYGTEEEDGTDIPADDDQDGEEGVQANEVEPITDNG